MSIKKEPPITGWIIHDLEVREVNLIPHPSYPGYYKEEFIYPGTPILPSLIYLSREDAEKNLWTTLIEDTRQLKRDVEYLETRVRELEQR